MTINRTWLRITDCRNIPLREGRCVVAGRHEIAIFNLGGRFLAVENRCPHRGGPLADGIVSGTTVVCPLHAWKANLETGSVAGSAGAVGCLKTFDVRVQDGCISLAIPVTREDTEDGPTAHNGDKCTSSWLSAEMLRGDESKGGNAEI